mgnify:FL=1|tara:strand:+ start:6047 stop:7027 length:981 start_codon:yes stop_codon:yes gene_type:complete
MANLQPLTEFDIVFISYDEPNAESNYADLLDKCPWAKRSHGVWGSDAAHKAAAALSETDRFITVDADNIVREEFFNAQIDVSRIRPTDVISWAGKNEVNGLVYGNGGIKCWPVDVVNRMRTHEAAPESDKASQVDFCWNIRYIQMNNVYCDVMNNGSPLQAWRAGFREGVKMGLEGGDVVDPKNLKRIHQENYKRLLVWMTVGEDTINGLWAMYGARLGCHMTNIERRTWDWRNVRDFDWLSNFFKTELFPEFEGGDQMCVNTGVSWDYDKLKNKTVELGEDLRGKLDLEISDLDWTGSRFFKKVYKNPHRLGAMVREDQVDDSIE